VGQAAVCTEIIAPHGATCISRYYVFITITVVGGFGGSQYGFTDSVRKGMIPKDLAERGGFEPPLGCLFPKTV
jgi:hypothetical protein